MMVNYLNESLKSDFNNMVNELVGKKANGHILRRFRNWCVDAYNDNLWTFSGKKGVVNIIISNGEVSRVCGFFKLTDNEMDWNAWR